MASEGVPSRSLQTSRFAAISPFPLSEPRPSHEKQSADEADRQEPAVVSLDPTAVAKFVSSRDGYRGPSNLNFCNRSSTEIQVAMVRSKGKFGGLFFGRSWVADGYYSIQPSDCIYRNFGYAENLSYGYISILEKRGGRWIPKLTEGRGQARVAMIVWQNFRGTPDTSAGPRLRMTRIPIEPVQGAIGTSNLLTISALLAMSSDLPLTSQIPV